jgi:RNA polymerase sigma-70 factor (ECF subfamily)
MTGARDRPETPVETTIIAVARTSYGRLLALLSSRDGDIAASEDALSEAFSAALMTWPQRGIPDNPDAWLLTAARNRLTNAHRHADLKRRSTEEMMLRLEERSSCGDSIPDRRLAMMFVCAHPAIQEDVRTPLMLQTVLGMDAQRIASAFLVSPTTMGQRLVRAKAKIKAAGIGFQLPDLEHLPARLDDVLCAIYVAFGTAWDGVAEAKDGRAALADEAIFLARIVVALMPEEPEALGLLALMLYIDARKGARWDADKGFVPLKDQDSKLWSRDKIIEAEHLLSSASRKLRFGRFQCEAAIQSVHVQAPINGKTNWKALKTLHEMLLQHRPSVGAFVSYGAVLLGMGNADQALEVLHSLDEGDIAHYQPYWVTLAAAHDVLGDKPAASAARSRAIDLTDNAAIQAFLLAETTP